MSAIPEPKLETHFDDLTWALEKARWLNDLFFKHIESDGGFEGTGRVSDGDIAIVGHLVDEQLALVDAAAGAMWHLTKPAAPGDPAA